MRRNFLPLIPPLLLVAGSALGAPVITEVAWMGSTSASGDEFVEIYNPGPGAISDLSQYVLVEGATERALPAVALAEGEVLVLEANASATSLSSPAAEVVAVSLNNGGEALRLCPVGAAGDVAQCDVANTSGSWPAGSNDAPKRTMVRVDASLDGALSTSWLTYAGDDSGVSDSGGVAIKGSPGVYAVVVPDAGPPPVDAGPLPPPPAITEVAWMGSASSSNDEWVELYNAGPDDIADLSRFVLVENGGPVALPAVPLAAGGVVVIERSAGATSLSPPEAEIGSLSLTNSGTTEFLRVCPADAPNDVFGCEIALVQGSSWPAGDNDSKRTMIRLDASLDGSFASSWATYAGAASAVTDSLGVAILGSPGSYAPSEIEPQPDGGPVALDGGVIVVPDAGPNAAPTLTLTQPSGEVRAGQVTIAYAARDDDGDDTVAVSLFYDSDGGGHDGVRIAYGLPAGEGSFTWSTAQVAAGSYRIFGVATDHRGAVSYAYAPGSVVVEGGPGGDEASITLTDPDGVNDVVDGRITVRWELTLPEGEDGSVSLFYDTDDAGLDGVPIIAGLPVRTSDGEDGPRAYLWDPVDVQQGAYAIYAVLDWTGGQASGYSEFVSVGAGGCACATARSSGDDAGAAFAALFTLVIVLAPRARRRRQNGASC